MIAVNIGFRDLILGLSHFVGFDFDYEFSKSDKFEFGFGYLKIQSKSDPTRMP